MDQYLNNLCQIVNHGHRHPARTKSDRITIFGHLREEYDHADGLPVVTTRRLPLVNLVKELCWMIRGESNINAKDAPTAIWNKWAVTKEDIDKLCEERMVALKNDPDFVENENTAELLKRFPDTFYKKWEKEIGNIGHLYGPIWRNAPAPRTLLNERFALQPRTFSQLPSDKVEFYRKQYEELTYMAQSTPDGGFEQFAVTQYRNTFDQLNELLLGLKEYPHSSRHVVTAWVPGFIPPENIKPSYAALLGFGALAPCHAFFQFYVRKEGTVTYLDLEMYQRSVDYPVGRPFNIAQYAILQALIAHCSDMVPGKLFLPTGDAHIYANQLELVKEQILRTPYPRPTLWLNPEKKDLFSFTHEDIKIVGYEHYPAIDYPVEE